MIEKVHGIHATAMSMNDRFTMLATAIPDRVGQRPRRRPPVPYMNRNLNSMNQNLIEQIARRLELQAKRFAAQQALRQRMGLQGTLRRFGSESSLPGLRRSNSFGSLNQGQSIKNRVAWRQSNGNLNRSASFSNLSTAMRNGRPLRGFRRRGGGQRALRGRFRVGNGVGVGVGGRMVSGGARGRARGRVAGGPGRLQGQGQGGQGQGRVQGGQAGAATPRPQTARRGNASRGRGRGGVLRNQTPKPAPTKEELDAQLDQYMAGTKAALDRELDTYMKNAMDLE